MDALPTYLGNTAQKTWGGGLTPPKGQLSAVGSLSMAGSWTPQLAPKGHFGKMPGLQPPGAVAAGTQAGGSSFCLG